MDYWDAFYEKHAVPTVPSQFAVFALDEMGDTRTVIEIGCGNGRDSVAFAQYGKEVLALDQSPPAIETAQNLASSSGVRKITFLSGDLTFLSVEKIGKVPAPKVVYARFFLHAINDDDLETFFKLSSAILYEGEKVFVEYRGPEDKEREKVTPKHYRAYRSGLDVSKIAKSEGFLLSYEVEGVGFAKYQQDDAHVVRQIFIKSNPTE